MKVILTENVPNIGNLGEIVNVSAGHGRNYLIPKNLATVADDAHKKSIENQQKRLAKKIEKQKSAAMAVKKKIDGLSIEFVKRVGTNGKLFGTVTTNEIAKEMEKKGLLLDRRQLTVLAPIKSIGAFKINCKVFTDVIAEFEIKVVMDPKQIEEIKAKQEANEKKAAERKAKGEDQAGKKSAASETAAATEEEKIQEEANKILRSYD